MSAHQQVVARIQHLLETVEPAPSIARLGEAVGLSPSYLQRVFKRATGLSSREYAAALRTERLKAGLKEGRSVTEAMYDAGYGSSRALYETAHQELGMSPGRYKQGGMGVRITYALSDSPMGRFLIAATDKGVCALRFGEDDALVLRAEFPLATLVHDREAVPPSSRRSAITCPGDKVT